MSKNSIREQRRAARAARIRRQRTIYGVIIGALVLLTAFVAYRIWAQQNELEVSAASTSTAQAATNTVLAATSAAQGASLSGTQTAVVANATPFGAESDAEMVTLDSGLQYQDLQVGEGDEASEGDSITIHYTGWLADGTKFDSSLDRGQPATFTLASGSLIEGWVQGVPGMKVGGIRKLYIPSDLGYGPEGNPPTIPGNATLVFQVELLGVNQ